MTVIVTKKSSARKIANAKRKLRSRKNIKSGISRYFGALKRGLDGLDYQKDARNEWH